MSRANAQARAAKRLRWGAGLAMALLLVIAGAYLYQARVAAAGELVGGAIAAPSQPAPDFILTDQFGQSQSLRTLSGKPVALTFIYTNCPDVCPIISANMHRAYGLLGNRAAQTGLLAVTVDPERDDVQQVRKYSDQIGLSNEWHFLTGSRPQLEAVWAAYGIDAQKAPGGPAASGATAGTAAVANPAEEIEHAAPVYLIDKHGLVRAMLPTDVTADDIAHDLGVLLAEQ
jgi:protein SCO1